VLVAAAVCPHPPILVPRLAAGAASELDDLRAACAEAIAALLAAEPNRLAVAGGGRAVEGSARGGSLRPYGIEEHVGAAADDSLPLSLTIGAWLLEQVDCALPVEYVGFADDVGPQECADRLAAIVAGDTRTAVLVMADLSAKLTEASPGYLDERAPGFDRAVVRAIEETDAGALLAVDGHLAAELWCSGASALWGLAGAAQGVEPGSLTARILYDAAPYGVGYVVATWGRRLSQAVGSDGGASSPSSPDASSSSPDASSSSPDASSSSSPDASSFRGGASSAGGDVVGS
jgi:hypothetical protein